MYEQNHGCGTVLGSIFRRDGTDNRPSPENLQTTKGECLVEQFWGSYVAILKEDHGPRVWVLRDPTGHLPCFVTDFGRIHVIFSHVDDCVALQLIDASINWDHVAAYLWFDHLVTSETGLEGVRQVQAGERLEIGPEGMTASYLWRPDSFCRKPFVEDRQFAREQLRGVIEQCVGTWASSYSSVLHQLSGGLDSAVVLACLARIKDPVHIVCENHFANNTESDERLFAREAANAAGVELIETQIPPSERPLDHCFETAKVATPAHSVFLPETHAAKKQRVQSHGIEAVFSGQGGDHFFQRSRNTHIAAEYIRRHGLNGDLFRIISDTSRFTNKPIWSVAATTVSSGLFRKPSNPYDIVKRSPLVSREALDAINFDEIRHPWVDAARDLPGSKQEQIFNVIDSQVFRHMPNCGADIVHPLISQPIIELCLQIPSYLLTYGGIDRALVRDAFEGLVPSSILRRTTKGATTGYFIGLLVRNITVLREFLLEGVLVSQGLLNKPALEDALTERSLIRSHNVLFPVLIAFRAEIWARSWSNNDRPATR
ncbi:asparagine synthase-related protein [Woeseia oceani]|uniref:asparagine synthase (glutamine-hydrolyzing) n=1 Tax=Woeseia oceani TaxID=1548547 RepID=A0A193LC11_9GAMM|nr:asparagine synthase-related protein [Woeseia oceani]ANO50070.1 hypothetical protein BA177_01500 [Woeseia oceani]